MRPSHWPPGLMAIAPYVVDARPMIDLLCTPLHHDYANKVVFKDMQMLFEMRSEVGLRYPMSRGNTDPQ